MGLDPVVDDQNILESFPKMIYFRLESQCVTAISFVKNEPELLDR